MKTWRELEAEQPYAVQVLTNSIKRNRVSHAYLLQGMRGTGKLELAKTLTKAIFCAYLVEAEPCQECNTCIRIESGNHPDVHFIKPDGQSIKIEQIRHLQKEFTYSGVESNKKAYVIEGAETLTVNAANRILKFLEEPSKQTTALLLTENGQAMIPTIRSRCQIIDLQPLQTNTLEKQLIEHEVPAEFARLLVVLTNNLTEAIELFEDAAFADTRNLVVQWMKVVAEQKDDLYLFVHQRWLSELKERTSLELGLDLLLIAYKDLLYYLLGDLNRIILFDQTDENVLQYALQYQKSDILRYLNVILYAKRELKQNVQPTLVMEKLALQVKK